MLLVANLAIQIMQKKTRKKEWNPGTWVLIWEYSARAIQWIPIWQGLDGFQKYLLPCAMDESSLSIGRVNPFVLITTETSLSLFEISFWQKYLFENAARWKV